MSLSIGLHTPPAGACCFVVCSISRIWLQRMVRAVLPFLPVEIGVLVVVSCLPRAVVVIPQLLGYP